MKRKKIMVLSVLFLFALSTGFLSPSVSFSLWYGDKIAPEHIDEDTALNLNNYIIENVLTDEFRQSLRGIDNNPDEMT